MDPMIFFIFGFIAAAIVSSMSVSVSAAAAEAATASPDIHSCSSLSFWWTLLLQPSSSSNSSSTSNPPLAGIFTFLLGDVYTALYTFLVFVYLGSRFVYEYEIIFFEKSQRQSQRIVPFPIIFRKKKNRTNKNEEDDSGTRLVQQQDGGDGKKKEEEELPPKPIDLTGQYKLVENINFEDFLAAQGVPWALRRAANSARPIHKITHHSSKFITIQICGIIESSTTYEIGGPPVLGEVRGRNFSDQVQYMTKHESKYDIDLLQQQQQQQQQQRQQQNESDGSDNDNNENDDDHPKSSVLKEEEIVGIQTTKRALDDGYTVVVQRRLLVLLPSSSEEEGSGPGSTSPESETLRGNSNSNSSSNNSKSISKIIMTSSVTFDDPARHAENVISKQIFERVV